MKSSGDFSCTIKLRRELKNGGASSVEEVPFGASIQDASHIELGIRRAQKALLNPGTDASTFLEYVPSLSLVSTIRIYESGLSKVHEIILNLLSYNLYTWCRHY